MTKKAWDDESSSQKEGKTLTPDTNNLIVKIIEDNTIVLHESFGITVADTKRLQTKLYELLEEKSKKKQGNKSLSQVIVELSKECVHVNQLAFICFALGRSTSPSNEERSRNSQIGAIGINRKTGEMKHFGNGEGLPDYLKDILRDILKGEGGLDKDMD